MTNKETGRYDYKSMNLWKTIRPLIFLSELSAFAGAGLNLLAGGQIEQWGAMSLLGVALLRANRYALNQSSKRDLAQHYPISEKK